jgi:hypothetical protein
MDVSAACDVAEKLLRAAVPDFDGVPIYFVLPSDVNAPGGSEGDTLGCTHGAFDLAMESILRASGRWRGRGFGCFLDVGAIGDDLERFVAIAVHEAAHNLTEPINVVTAPREELPDYYRLLSDSKANLSNLQNPGEIPRRKNLVPWRKHESPFLRALAHLAYRSLCCGWPLWGLRPERPVFYCARG